MRFAALCDAVIICIMADLIYFFLLLGLTFLYSKSVTIAWKYAEYAEAYKYRRYKLTHIHTYRYEYVYIQTHSRKLGDVWIHQKRKMIG